MFYIACSIFITFSYFSQVISTSIKWNLYAISVVWRSPQCLILNCICTMHTIEIAGQALSLHWTSKFCFYLMYFLLPLYWYILYFIFILISAPSLTHLHQHRPLQRLCASRCFKPPPTQAALSKGTTRMMISPMKLLSRLTWHARRILWKPLQ